MGHSEQLKLNPKPWFFPRNLPKPTVKNWGTITTLITEMPAFQNEKEECIFSEAQTAKVCGPKIEAQRVKMWVGF